MIVKRNEHGDITWTIDNQVVAELFNGRRNNMTGEITRGIIGYTIKYINTMGTTSIHLQSKDEALDTINNVIENLDDIFELRDKINDYCSKNKWTYSGT